MGAALYIALEKEMPGINTMIDGKMLSRAEKHLDGAAKRMGVRPLMEFFGMAADDAADLVGEDIDGVELPQAQWFTPEEGLKTIDALLGVADASPVSRAAKPDLLACQRVLREAQKHGVRWHLAVDF